LHYYPNRPATATHSPPIDTPSTMPPLTRQRQNRSFLSWPAWQRVLAILPALVLLWLGVWWAGMESTRW